MPWKKMDVQEQRVSFVVLAERREKPLTSLCQEFGISRPTGYLWLSRFREGGVSAIAERSRRPGRSPERTAPEIEAQVVTLRQRYPDWGARKLQVLLQQHGIALAPSTVHRILLRHGLIGEEERRDLAPGRFERAAPNELWQMDFKGPLCVAEQVGPLSVLDDHSRYLLVLQRVADHGGELVREHLQGAFTECGVPEGMLMDHGTPWWSARSPHGYTKLSLWLMQQGIALHWGRIRHPQTQGKIERFHGELKRALQKRPPRSDLQSWLDEFRWEHNHVRPHEALGMQTPVTHWRRSERRYQANPPPWEYPTGSRGLKVDREGKITLKGENWRISKALSGERVRLVMIEQRVLVYYCRTLVREIDLGSQRSTMVDRWLPDESSPPEL
jgi:transposase InsO family protein